MDGESSRIASTAPKGYFNPYAPRERIRKLFGVESAFQSTNDSVKLSIYKNNAYNENAEFYGSSRHEQVDKNSSTVPSGKYIEHAKDTNIYSRRTLSLSVTTDEGDTINISSDAFQNLITTTYASSGYQTFGGSGGHVNLNTKASVIGEVNEVESADFNEILSKATKILDLSVKVAAGKASEADLEKAIAELGNGNVDNNSLSLVNVSIDVESATGEQEYSFLEDLPSVLLDDSRVVQVDKNLMEEKIKNSSEIPSSVENSKIKYVITKYYEDLLSKIAGEFGDSATEFLTKTYNQLINLNIKIFKENKFLHGEVSE